MNKLLLTTILGLLLIALLACGGASEDDAAARADEVVPRVKELMLEASFSPEAECRELAAQFAEDYDVAGMPYADSGPREALSRLDKLEDGLKDFEEDLEDAGCTS